MQLHIPVLVRNLNKEVRSDETKLADDIMLFVEGKRRCGCRELQKDLSILGLNYSSSTIWETVVLAQDLIETYALLKHR